MVSPIGLPRYCCPKNISNTPFQLPVKFNLFSNTSSFTFSKIQLYFTLCSEFFVSFIVISSNFSYHVPSFIHVLITHLKLRTESSLWPAHSCSCHHSGSPHRSSLAFLSFRVASVHSKPHVRFETTISKLNVSGLCAADLLLASVKEGTPNLTEGCYRI